jgi:hypothetical protein
MNPSQGRYLHKEQHKHRINEHRYLCLEWASNLIAAFVRVKTIHALDRAAHVIAHDYVYGRKMTIKRRKFM